MKNYIELNETTTFNGKKVKPKLSTGEGCAKCVFESDCSPKAFNRPPCMAHEREDKNSVYFVKA